MINTEPRAYMTPRELAERWQKTEQTLANMRSLGRGVEWVKIGRSVLYPVEAVLAYEAAGRRGVAA